MVTILGSDNIKNVINTTDKEMAKNCVLLSDALINELEKIKNK